MKGLELAKQYWQEEGRSALEKACPGIMEHAAAGLVGEGSDCFGYDDLISRDHDWGPGFCLWLDDYGLEKFGGAAKEIYAALPEEFLGCRRINASEQTAGRVGVSGVGEFYRRLIGTDAPPETIAQWRQIPEYALAAATNGEVFFDAPGEFSAVRGALLKYYPEDLRLKKLACHCALAAQAGQYNYRRCKRRAEDVAALLALAQFAGHIQEAVFALNRCYRPYYKWANRRMRELPLAGDELASLLEGLTVGSGDKSGKIERVSACLISALRAQGLTDSEDDYLLSHAGQIALRIEDKALRDEHIMTE